MKILNQRQLPSDRLATTDERGHRLYVIPAEVKGWYQTWRRRLHWLLMLVFILLPWIKLNGSQLVLLDLPGRRFAFFGLTFWAHDAPLLFLVFMSLAFTLATATALAGRVWCGWACPQTVFIEALYRPLERLIIGNHIKQKDFYLQPMSLGKVGKLTVKWLAFFAVSFVIGHSFLAYFVGSDRILNMILASPFANWTNFLLASFSTALVLFDFGWFREQFCIIMCPYGRFQSVLVGKNSYNIMYDSKRGEPRKMPGLKSHGDCINCFKCVTVCPTGIDIRNGTQLECVACTACIDACDDVMLKTQRPRGLIRYASVNSLEGHQAPLLRRRTILYLMITMGMLAGLCLAVLFRHPVRLAVIRGQDIPYQVIQNEVINHFKLHAQNDEIIDLTVVPEVDDPAVTVVVPTGKFLLKAGGNDTMHFFVKFPASYVAQTGERELPIRWVLHHKNKIMGSSLVRILGPKLTLTN